MVETTSNRLSRLREPFCGLSHFAGAILSVIALIALLILSHGRVWHTLGFTIYGLSFINLYFASGLYHSVHAEPERLVKYQKFDHVAIFWVIVGSYAPLCLTLLRGPLGWKLFWIEIGLAVIGSALVLSRRGIPHWFRILIYVLMGWLITIVFPAMHQILPPSSFAWMIGGGIIYSVGTVILAADWPHLWRGRFSAHDLWHIFVLVGSACHFYFYVRYVAL